MTDDTEAEIIETEIEEREETFSRAEFVAKLRQLADALEKGDGADIEIADEAVALPKEAVYSAAYEGDEDEEAIAFQVSWSRSEQD